MGHTAVLIDTTLVVFGGRDSPARALNDVWALDTDTWQWQHITCKGEGPAPRFRHTAVAIGSALQACQFDLCASMTMQHKYVWQLHDCKHWQMLSSLCNLQFYAVLAAYLFSSVLPGGNLCRLATA